MTSLRQWGEFGLIEHLARGLTVAKEVDLGVGDDCAVVRTSGSRWLLTCDAMVEDVHFRRDWASPDAIGWKAVAAALSDIAAMGGKARFLLITLACPGSTDVAWIESLYAGMHKAAVTYSARIVGGDTVLDPEHVTINVSVIGEPAGIEPILRSGARPGDLIAVTGWPGRAAAGLEALQRGLHAPRDLLDAHRLPYPRLREGVLLAEHEGIHAMIDISDGLIQDLGHMATRSGVGMNIETDSVPVAPSLHTFAASLQQPFIHYVLYGGEDYELAVAFAAGEAASLSQEFARHFNLPLTIIGAVTSEQPGVLLDGEVPPCSGFDHFRERK